MQLLGRRRILMLSSPIWVLGWSLIALAQNYEMMLFARMLTGFCIGLVTPSAAVYVSCNFVIVYLIYVSYKFVVFVQSSKNNSNPGSLTHINSMSLLVAICLFCDPLNSTV